MLVYLGPPDPSSTSPHPCSWAYLQVARITEGSRAGLEALYLPLLMRSSARAQSQAPGGTRASASTTQPREPLMGQATEPAGVDAAPRTSGSDSCGSSSTDYGESSSVNSSTGSSSRSSLETRAHLADVAEVEAIGGTSPGSAMWRQSVSPECRQALIQELPPALLVKVR